MVAAIFGVIAFVFFPDQTRPYRKRVLGVVLTLVLGFKLFF